MGTQGASPAVYSGQAEAVYEQLYSYALGVFLAVVTIYPARFLDPQRERRFLTAVIAVVVVGFFGFPLAAGDPVGLAWELAAVVALGAIVLLSLRHPGLLPLAWLGHGAWDLLFLIGAIPVDKPVWICRLCVPYDWIVGAYVATRVGRWRAWASDTG